MQKSEAKVKFEQADILYREQKYEEALFVLAELDTTFPRQQNIMYPRARCLVKLGRDKDALAVLDEIIDNFKYDKARELRSLILTQEPILDAPALDEAVIFEFDDMKSEVQPTRPSSSDHLAFSTGSKNHGKLIENNDLDTKTSSRPEAPWLRIAVVSAIVVLTLIGGYLALFR